ncbi:MAG: ABC transporter permease [Eubacterium sp.]|nr:ABC transporter permease [Eubacterium sp.]
MFSNVFSKQLKIGLRNRPNIFWTLMFPVLLGTLFYVAFGSIFETYHSEPIKTSVIYETEDAGVKEYINEFLTSLTMNDNKLLDIVEAPVDEMDKMLEDEKINGIITVGKDGRLKLKIASNGNKSTIQENIVTAYNQSADLVEKVAAEHPEKLEEVLAKISDRVSFVNAKDMAGDNKDPYVQYFYNLIAMTTLFAALNSLRIGNNCQANMSAIGARTNASPLKRTVFQLGGFLASYLVQTIIVFIGLAYMIFGLKVKFGGEVPLIFATTALASLLGIALGFMVGNFGSMAVEKKESILVAIILGSCALSGLMMGDMKPMIAEKAPIVNKINPAAVISDSYYCLNMFGTGSRFFTCIIYMAGLSVIFTVVGMMLGRRQSYDSI